MGFFSSLFSSSSDPNAMANATQKVQDLTKKNAVVVFSKSYCPYCASTKSTLKKLGAQFELLELDQESDGSALQDALQELTGQRTVPNIFIGGKSIGGNSDLQSLAKGGDLESALKNVGAL